jgi:transposase-like protein
MLSEYDKIEAQDCISNRGFSVATIAKRYGITEDELFRELGIKYQSTDSNNKASKSNT